MASLLIVSGAPGTGKTTLAAALAAAAPRGLHLRSDVFYGFPAHPIDPATPGAHAQNRCVIRAVGRAAGAFAEGGYDVFLDGIFGPWFLAELIGALGPSSAPPDYVVLRADPDEAVARVARRDGPGAEGRVRHMHRALADLGALEGHALDTRGASPARARAELERRRACGALRLPPSLRGG
jgi:predicted kinase